MCCLNQKMRRLNHVNIIQFLSLQQNNYPDLPLEDRPRSQDADLNQSPYVEMMKPRV